MKKLTEAQKNWFKANKNYVDGLLSTIKDDENVILSCGIDKQIANRRIKSTKERICLLKKQVALSLQAASDYKKSLK